MGINKQHSRRLVELMRFMFQWKSNCTVRLFTFLEILLIILLYSFIDVYATSIALFKKENSGK